MLVDEDHPAVDEVGGYVLAAADEIARKYASAKSKGRVVGRFDRLLLVFAGTTAATGPKTSSSKAGIPLVTSVNTVGG
jgi:hypothetical protein